MENIHSRRDNNLVTDYINRAFARMRHTNVKDKDKDYAVERKKKELFTFWTLGDDIKDDSAAEDCVKNAALNYAYHHNLTRAFQKMLVKIVLCCDVHNLGNAANFNCVFFGPQRSGKSTLAVQIGLEKFKLQVLIWHRKIRMFWTKTGSKTLQALSVAIKKDWYFTIIIQDESNNEEGEGSDSSKERLTNLQRSDRFTGMDTYKLCPTKQYIDGCIFAISPAGFSRKGEERYLETRDTSQCYMRFILWEIQPAKDGGVYEPKGFVITRVTEAMEYMKKNKYVETFKSVAMKEMANNLGSVSSQTEATQEKMKQDAGVLLAAAIKKGWEGKPLNALDNILDQLRADRLISCTTKEETKLKHLTQDLFFNKESNEADEDTSQKAIHTPSTQVELSAIGTFPEYIRTIITPVDKLKAEILYLWAIGTNQRDIADDKVLKTNRTFVGDTIQDFSVNGLQHNDALRSGYLFEDWTALIHGGDQRGSKLPHNDHDADVIAKDTGMIYSCKCKAMTEKKMRFGVPEDVKPEYEEAIKQGKIFTVTYFNPKWGPAPFEKVVDPKAKEIAVIFEKPKK
jgi:hypothetical protein